MKKKGVISGLENTVMLVSKAGRLSSLNFPPVKMHAYTCAEKFRHSLLKTISLINKKKSLTNNTSESAGAIILSVRTKQARLYEDTRLNERPSGVPTEDCGFCKARKNKTVSGKIAYPPDVGTHQRQTRSDIGADEEYKEVMKRARKKQKKRKKRSTRRLVFAVPIGNMRCLRPVKTKRGALELGPDGGPSGLEEAASRKGSAGA
ncbi:hypothetical protein HPB48_005244 [Haemaphysalis longicornis]|uniref:Uncharacterized protein n=1 Tax=Haemaphysalis longicornis TaxID=44386 RepID=A0A9J6FU95_HAELO|nr:hypothetical protein HPB48_005244 [Haemaphysalis longicornis]